MEIIKNDQAGTRAMAGPDEQGAWSSIRSFFVPREELPGYAEGLRRGHVMLVVRPPAGFRERIVDILESYDPIDFDARMQHWRSEGWTERALPAAPEIGEGEQNIPVVEENVRVGKRVVDRGGVRVRSYVIEEPVSEDVALREEHVEVERHPVDRPAGPLPDDAFRERTIEVSASSEEPVVQKEARVVEEVSLRKTAGERTETVRDTARKTKVEIEDNRTGKPKR
jgi:uncharacterized protein (TIGR02271 family)